MKIYKITEASEYLGVSTMPNLQEIKARRGEHEALKQAVGITEANCSTCYWLGSDGDGYEYNGMWPVCTHPEYEYRSYLEKFPFNTDQECWAPEFWHSRFAGQIETGEHEEIVRLVEQFNEAIKEDF